MERLSVQIPSGEGYLPGDVVEIAVDGVIVARGLSLTPGVVPAAPHLQGAHLATPHLQADNVAGHLQGRHLADPHLQPRRWIRFVTQELYHGLHAIAAEAFDAYRNAQAGGATEVDKFVNTGPSAPRGIKFASQVGAGPIVFRFTPSTQFG